MAKGRGRDGDTVRWHEPQSPRVVVVVGGGKTPPPPPTPEAQGPGFSEAGRWKDNSPCEPKMLGILFSVLQSSRDLGGRRFQEDFRRRKNTEEVGMRAKDERSKGPAFRVITRHEWTVCHQGSV